MFEEAKKYYEQFGDLNIPHSYKTSDGKSLGSWLSKQRRDRKDGRLSEDKTNQLDTINMRWEAFSDELWDSALQHLQSYVIEHGNADFTNTYVCDDGFKLGAWATRQRKSLRRKDCPIPEEKKALLEKYGISSCFKASKASSREEAWEVGFGELKKYLSKYGVKTIPDDYTTEEGSKLKNWVTRQYKLIKKGELTEYKAQKLNNLGVDLNTLLSGDRGWSESFEKLRVFMSENKRLPKATDDEKPLYTWLKGQKRLYSKGTLIKEREQKLRSIGIEL